MNSLLPSATALANDVDLNTDTVTPGVLGFLIIFVIGVGLFFLMRNFMGKIRDLPKGEEFAARVEASNAEAAEKGDAPPAGAGQSEEDGNADGTDTQERKDAPGDTEGPSPQV